LDAIPPARWRVGACAVDPRALEIARDGVRHRVTPKAIGVLRVLCETPGMTLLRDELLERAWPDSVPTHDVLSHAIKELRRAFGDSVDAPRYIETIPKIGYRLLAQISDFESPHAEPLSPTHPDTPTLAASRRSVGARIVFAGLASVAAVALLLLAHSRLRTEPIATGAAFAVDRIEVATSDAGVEAWPALSPDGKRLAYTQRDANGLETLHLREHDGSMRVLDDTPGQLVIGPVFAGADDLVLLTARGEACEFESLALNSGARRTLGSCSPDAVLRFAFDPTLGRLFHTPHQGRTGGSAPITVLDTVTGSSRTLDYAHDPAIYDSVISLSPDGSRLAFRRGFPHSDLYEVESVGGAMRRLTDLQSHLRGHTWLPDNRHLVVASDHEGRSALYLLDRETLALTALGPRDAYSPTAARASWRVAYEQHRASTRLVQLMHGDTLPQPQPLHPSSGSERDPAWSPDGRRLAFVSDRTGSDQVWVAIDGAAPRRVTEVESSAVESPQFSLDGESVFYLVRDARGARVRETAIASGATRELSIGIPRLRSLAMGADGWLHFAGQYAGSHTLCRARLQDNAPAPDCGGPRHVVALRASTADRRVHFVGSDRSGIRTWDWDTREETLLVPDYPGWLAGFWQVTERMLWQVVENPDGSSQLLGHLLPIDGSAPVFSIPMEPGQYIADVGIAARADDSVVIVAQSARREADIHVLSLRPTSENSP
jgi:DNA-binding winged helix-turn-helix (wHTH) protein